VLSKKDWLAAQLVRQQLARKHRTAWRHGSRILLEGAEVELRVDAGGRELALGGERVRLHAGEVDELRPAVRRHLVKRARAELPPRVLAEAVRHGLRVARVVVRDQKSRWGSCSHRREISLNWRLLQAPGFVRDYLIVHELMHLREMNHGARFWAHVEAACPGWREAEAWLKRHNDVLRDGR
ncbi:MAG: M48 family metallopeptidase, partial [Limisphaerales bacterium]